GASVLELGPLDADDLTNLVARHVADPSAELVHQIAALSGGIPFAVNELARRAAEEPRWVQSLDANMIGGIDPATRAVLQRVAVVGSSFDTDAVVALSALSQGGAFARLDPALPPPRVGPAGAGYRLPH